MVVVVMLAPTVMRVIMLVLSIMLVSMLARMLVVSSTDAMFVVAMMSGLG